MKNKKVKKCKIKNCNKDHQALGLCKLHYERQRIYGRTSKLENFNCMGCGIETVNKNNDTTKIKELKNCCSFCYKKELRNLIIKKLGNKCSCCGEKIRAFLDIDHIKGEGYKIRKNNNTGISYYHDIYLDRGLRKKYRVLCRNCNWGVYAGPNKTCPHKIHK